MNYACNSNRSSYSLSNFKLITKIYIDEVFLFSHFIFKYFKTIFLLIIFMSNYKFTQLMFLFAFFSSLFLMNIRFNIGWLKSQHRQIITNRTNGQVSLCTRRVLFGWLLFRYISERATMYHFVSHRCRWQLVYRPVWRWRVYSRPR